MRVDRRAAQLAAVLATCAISAPALAADEILVTVDQPRVATELGRNFGVTTTITNRGSVPSVAVLAHLNVLSLTSDVYVDPEDWSSERTRYLGVLPAGASTTINWKLKAVNPGRFATFVSVLPEAGSTDAPTNGANVTISVATRQTLNSGGILPLAIGIPAALALLTVSVRVRRSRR